MGGKSPDRILRLGFVGPSGGNFVEALRDSQLGLLLLQLPLLGGPHVGYVLRVGVVLVAVGEAVDYDGDGEAQDEDAKECG